MVGRRIRGMLSLGEGKQREKIKCVYMHTCIYRSELDWKIDEEEDDDDAKKKAQRSITSRLVVVSRG